MSKIEQKLTSMEVAHMVGKEHKYLMRDIRNYSTDMTGAEISPVEFWIESTYTDSKGQIRPCYAITKKGCEFIAHKLTGKKGTEFTARYINRFHELENAIEGVVEAGNSTTRIQGVQTLIECQQQFMERQQQFYEQQEKLSQMMIEKLENLLRIRKPISNDSNCFSTCIGEKDELQGRREKLDRLVEEMAAACKWEKNFALHRLYKTLEKMLDISMDDYKKVYQAETGKVCASAWKVVTDSDRLYEMAVTLCQNTINSMKCS
ncbi:MAG: Rha family transcriptional regulator [Lachnospiraceae bacterium]